MANEKIINYEKFLNEVLYEEYKQIFKERNGVLDVHSEYQTLKAKLELIRDYSLSSFSASVNLGENCLCSAEIPDSSKVTILVGAGVYVEFTINEGMEFIDKRNEQLKKTADELAINMAKVKTKMLLVKERLAELQGLAF